MKFTVLVVCVSPSNWRMKLFEEIVLLIIVILLPGINVFCFPANSKFRFVVSLYAAREIVKVEYVT